MKVKRNIIFNKSGGNSGKNGISYKLSLPSDMIRALGVTEDDRSVILKCENGKIIIEKMDEYE